MYETFIQTCLCRDCLAEKQGNCFQLDFSDDDLNESICLISQYFNAQC